MKQPICVLNDDLGHHLGHRPDSDRAMPPVQGVAFRRSTHAVTRFASGSVLALSCLLVLAGCASGPAPRDWQITAFEAQESALDNWLQGNDVLANTEFARAREAVASSARLDLLARLTLGRCAAEVASLNLTPTGNDPLCAEFGSLTADAKADEKAYFAYLNGNWEGIVAAQLPAAQRAVLALGASRTSVPETKALTAVVDPLSRLVACAVLFRRGQLSPEGITVAVDTASSQGWRRPLLAWLGVQAQRADAIGNAELAAQARRRIAFISNPRNK